MRESILEGKQQLVSEIKAKIEGSQSLVIVEYRGLTVDEVTDLRRKLRAENVDFKVYKNSMTKRAVEAAGYQGLEDSLKGPNAIAFGNEDAIAPARVLADFAKKHKALVLKSAVIEGKVLDSGEVKEISKLPNREGMYSMLLSCLQAPIRSFALAVKAVAEKEEN